MLFNVLDFPDQSATGGPDSLQAALALASNGDRIYMPGLAPYRAPAGGWVIRKGVEIFGDGPGNPDAAPGERTGTVLLPHSASTSDHVLKLVNEPATQLDRVFIHDLCIASSGESREGGNGILRETSLLKIAGLRLERIVISRLGGTGIRLIGGSGGPGAVNDLLVADCSIDNCGVDGIYIELGFAMVLSGLHVHNNVGRALRVRIGGEVAMYGCVFEAGGASALELVLIEQVVARIDACRFAAFDATTDKVGLRLSRVEGYGVVSGCTFELAGWTSASPGATGIDIENLPDVASGPICILPNRFLNIGTAIRGNVATKDNTHALFVAPQFGSPLVVGSQPASVIALPTVADNGVSGVPSVSDGSTSRNAGMLVPSLATLPQEQLQLPHMMYSSVDDKLRVWAVDWVDVILT